MNDLVIYYNGTLVTPQTKVQELTGSEQRSIQKLIRTHKADFEFFGKVEFKEIRTINSKNRINFKKIYYLNEQQATLLLTYMKNTPKVREAKKLLVLAFYNMEQALKRKQISHYINQIADQSVYIEQQEKHTALQINGYKSQLAQCNSKITKLRQELDTQGAKSQALALRCEALECEVLEAEIISAKNKASNDSLLRYIKQEREYSRRKYYELKKLFKCKN